MTLEQQAIKATLIGNLSLGLLGIAFSLLAFSEAVLLDGLFSLINFTMALVSLRIARQVGQPGDARYPFGYAVFEPVLNLGKGLILVMVSIYALVSALDVILSGGQQPSTLIVVIYALVAALVCFVFSAWLRRLNRLCQSPLLATDVENWMIDGLISGGVAVAFGLVMILRDTALAFVLPYVDPVLVVLIVVLTLPLPVKVIRDNWSQIVGASDPRLTGEVRDAIEPLLQGRGVVQLHVRQGRLGRALYVQLYLVMAAADGMDLAAQDALRTQLEQALRFTGGSLALDVIFTGESSWVRRSVSPA